MAGLLARLAISLGFAPHALMTLGLDDIAFWMHGLAQALAAQHARS